jgi:hypothetical protein
MYINLIFSSIHWFKIFKLPRERSEACCDETCVDKEYSAVYQGAYAVLVITSAWLPMLMPINHAPIFSLCNLVMLVITGSFGLPIFFCCFAGPLPQFFRVSVLIRFIVEFYPRIRLLHPGFHM